ncbi:MAG: hypothetical protein ACYC0V_11980 [Armatimonadota bacterium]
MKCKDAREIMNCLLDDVNHPKRDDAIRHMSGCIECAKWHESILSAVKSLELNTDYIELPDLSYRIMSMLPSRHPASFKSQSWKWKPGLILGWTFASWIIGVAVLCSLWFFIQSGFSGINIDQTASGAFTSIRSMSILFNDISAIPMAFARVISFLFLNYIGLNVIIIGFAILFIFDTAVAAAVIAIFRRKRMHGTMTI